MKKINGGSRNQIQGEIITLWCVGLLISCMFAYVISNIFMDSLFSHEYDPLLGKFTYTENTDYRNREEGWANTFIGKHNTFAVGAIDQNRLEKIAIWGDSEVEAFPVPDSHKMAQQVSKMFAQAGKEFLGVGIAHSDNSLADYVADLSRYETLIPNIEAHYIVICDLADTLPTAGKKRTKFEYRDGFRLVHSECRPPHHRILHHLSKYNLRIVSYLYGKISSYRLKLPWSHIATTANKNGILKELKSYDKLDAWEFILGELRKQSTRPITILYCPYIPTIQKGGVCLIDPLEQDKALFAAVCSRHNIKFIDLTEQFLNFFLTTNMFPRGFANTMPGKGHLNSHGHWLVAEAIFSNEVSRGLTMR